MARHIVSTGEICAHCGRLLPKGKRAFKSEEGEVYCQVSCLQAGRRSKNSAGQVDR